MSTAEIGKIAEIIRQNKVHIIFANSANLGEDIMNLVAHSHYKRVPNYRGFNATRRKWDRLKGLNRVTDTCIPEEESLGVCEKAHL